MENTEIVNERKKQWAIVAALLMDDGGEYIKPEDINDVKICFDKDVMDCLLKSVKYRMEGKSWSILEFNDIFEKRDLEQILNIEHECGSHLLPQARTILRGFKKELLTYKIQNKINLGELPDENDIQELKQYYNKNDKQTNYINVSDYLSKYLDRLAERRLGNHEHYSFGFRCFDETLGEILPGMLITIGGLPGVGKTNIALRLFTNLLKCGVNCMYLSSEMYVDSLIDRIASMESEDISAFDIRNATRLTDEDFIKITNLLDNSIYKKGKPIVIEVARFDVEQIRKYIKETETKFVFIDFIQMFWLDSDNRASAMSEIVTSLKELAMSCNVVVVALSQVNDDGQYKESRGIKEKSDICLKLSVEGQGFVDGREYKKIKCEIDKNRFGVQKDIILGQDTTTLSIKPL